MPELFADDHDADCLKAGGVCSPEEVEKARAGSCCGFHDRDGEPCAPDERGGYCCDNCPTLAAISRWGAS